MTDESRLAVRLGSGSDLLLHVGPIEIRLRPDPLETVIQTVGLDALVSSDDSVLSMSGGVSAVIAALAGSIVRDEVASQLPLPVGAIAVTSGGNLPLKYLIHAVTVDWGNDILPTRRTVQHLVRQILSRCEALGVRRLAIPALATGAAGLSAELSGRIIARALREHAQNPTALRLVVMPIPDLSVYRAFARELARPFLEEITAVQALEQPALHPDKSALVLSPKAPSAPLSLGASLQDPIGASVDDVTASRAPSRTTEDVTVVASVSRRMRGLRRWLSGTQRQSRTEETTESLETRPAAPVRDRLGDAIAAGASSRPLLSGRYVLLEEIGRGGMAIVYLSWDLVLRKNVAVKVLRPDAGDRESLRREATAALDLSHQCIVRVHHFEPASEQEMGYLVMEYVSWPSGEKWIADAGKALLPVESIVDVGVRICGALAHAHSRSFLHLDIKPSNVFVDPAGENAKIGDFGLAQVSNTGGSAIQLRPAGTPAYMAPEQQQAGAKVTWATDVYQLGATLWDFLTGHPPRPLNLDPDRFEPGRRELLGVLRAAMAPDPHLRPSAARLAELVVAHAP
jgi:O-acetyl-ADP-ribose deacetylase (regulator of RNase III)